MSGERRFRVGVASAEPCRGAVEGGFVQLGHGRSAPVRRFGPGDGSVLDAPREGMREGGAVQAFVAVGTVSEGEPYASDMGAGFVPTRRDARWDRAAGPAPIRPLLDRLSFTHGRPDWGMALRRGSFQVTAEGFAAVAKAMAAGPPQPSARQGSSIART